MTNLVFSELDRIFKDPVTAMVAIDCVVHHSVVLDMMAVESYRATAAKRSKSASAKMAATSEGAAVLIDATGKSN